VRTSPAWVSFRSLGSSGGADKRRRGGRGNAFKGQSQSHKKGVSATAKVKEEKVDGVLGDFIETSTKTIFTSDQLEPELDQSPYIPTASRIFQMPAAYVSPADLGYAYPNKGVPEFAFIGRSNVGKSSLIGTLLGHKSLVRTSKEPGCTRSVNYFSMGVPEKLPKLYLVDLPGYGFAKAAKTEQEKWRVIIQDFLLNRHPSILRRTFVLVDSRRGIKSADVEMMRLLDGAHVPYQCKRLAPLLFPPSIHRASYPLLQLTQTQFSPRKPRKPRKPSHK